MKTIATDTSATVRGEIPHVRRTSRTATILDALTRRAQAVLNDKAIDPHSRAVIRYALQTNDPWLARLVRQVDAGESNVASLDFSQTPETNDDHFVEQKIEALAEIICRAGNEPETKSAALLVLMGTLENSAHPKVFLNTVKHFAFIRCGEFNLYGMVDAEIAVVARAG